MPRPLVSLLALSLGCAPALAADEPGATASPGDLDPAAVVEQVASMPARGTSMATVRARLGAPEKRMAAVGDPPITRWVYPRFTVYFEHDRVLHSVKRDD